MSVLVLTSLSLTSCMMQDLRTAGESGARGHITYTISKIKQGNIILDREVAEREIEASKVPGDAANHADIVGKKATQDLEVGQVISCRAIGMPLTKEMSEKVILADYSSSKARKSTVVIATREIRQGEAFLEADLAAEQIPTDLVPMDALLDAKAAAGHKCKFGVHRRQIVTYHDIAAAN